MKMHDKYTDTFNLCFNGIVKELEIPINEASREKCSYSVFFRSVFSRIRTEYGEIAVSFRIQSECGKIQTRETPNM